MKAVLLVLCLAAIATCELRCEGDCQKGDPDSTMNRVMPVKIKQWEACHAAHKCPDTSVQNLGPVACQNGAAGEFPCHNVDLLSFINLESLGATDSGNDIWGWVDPATQHEYAIFGAYDGTSFVDVTDPTNPSVIGFLPTHTSGSSWRDIKVFKDHAFIVSEAPSHGMQVFDLTQLRSMARRPLFSINDTSAVAVPRLTETTHYNQFGNCHNIAINEETGFAYAVGSRTCSAGLHMIDINDPVKPKFAGCYSEDGYVHDTQCVIYRGPDAKFQGQEICFNFDEDTLTIVDVSVKSSPVTLSRISYPGYAYTHQGWLLDGQEFLLLDDELDEVYGSDKRTRTLVWDVKDLANPVRIGEFRSVETVIDHNLYILKDRAFQSNYCGGLRILDLSDAPKGVLSQAGYFDLAPQCSTTEFLGSWSNYPYFPSGNIVVTSIERGLFVVKYNGAAN